MMLRSLRFKSSDALVVGRALNKRFRGTWKGAMDAFCENLHDEEMLEDALGLYARAQRLVLASSELRRPLVPINWGAQETSNTARIAVFELATQIARSQDAESDLEPGVGLQNG